MGIESRLKRLEQIQTNVNSLPLIFFQIQEGQYESNGKIYNDAELEQIKRNKIIFIDDYGESDI